MPKDGVGDDIPVTYVPARNLVFLSLTLSFGEAAGARDLFIGVNALDYSGYPDCRPEFIASFAETARLGTKAGVEGTPFNIHAPLQHLGKAEIALECGEAGSRSGDELVVLRPDSRGTGMRSMRFVPPAPQGFCGCRYR